MKRLKTYWEWILRKEKEHEIIDAAWFLLAAVWYVPVLLIIALVVHFVK